MNLQRGSDDVLLSDSACKLSAKCRRWINLNLDGTHDPLLFLPNNSSTIQYKAFMWSGRCFFCWSYLVLRLFRHSCIIWAVFSDNSMTWLSQLIRNNFEDSLRLEIAEALEVAHLCKCFNPDFPIRSTKTWCILRTLLQVPYISLSPEPTAHYSTVPSNPLLSEMCITDQHCVQ